MEKPSLKQENLFILRADNLGCYVSGCIDFNVSCLARYGG